MRPSNPRQLSPALPLSFLFHFPLLIPLLAPAMPLSLSHSTLSLLYSTFPFSLHPKSSHFHFLLLPTRISTSPFSSLTSPSPHPSLLLPSPTSCSLPSPTVSPTLPHPSPFPSPHLTSSHTHTLPAHYPLTPFTHSQLIIPPPLPPPTHLPSQPRTPTFPQNSKI